MSNVIDLRTRTAHRDTRDTQLLRPPRLGAYSAADLSQGQRWRRLRLVTPWLALLLICAYQVYAALRVPMIATAFEDEALYVFMGHRMIEHITEGAVLHEFPGSYFSGAPAIYPVLVGMVDSVWGLPGARGLSIVCIVIATIGVFGLARMMFGSLAGVFAAAAFATCGSTIYQSNWATYDAMTAALIALGAWAAVYAGRHNSLLAGPAVSLILTLAILTKYAGVAYLPVIAALVVLDRWAEDRWTIVWRAAFMLAATAGLTFFLIMLWGRDIIPGIMQTTVTRNILAPMPRDAMVMELWDWFGPWLVAAFVGLLAMALFDRSKFLIGLVLFGALLLGPAQQIRMGENTSFAKHFAFGLIFGAVLIGYVLSKAVRWKWWLTAVPVAAVFALMGQHGWVTAADFRTSYSSEAELTRVLSKAIANNPGRPIMGERPSPQRYAFREETESRQWNDTYEFSYAGLSGPEAYGKAVDQHYFGVIFLSFSTKNANVISDHLGPNQVNGHYYHLIGKVPRYLHGEQIGVWLIWAPQTDKLTSID